MEPKDYNETLRDISKKARASFRKQERQALKELPPKARVAVIAARRRTK